LLDALDDHLIYRDRTMADILERMGEREIPFLMESFSALDRYFGVKEPGAVYVLTSSNLVDLAKLFEDLRYPGMPYEDAALHEDSTRYVFRCVERLDDYPVPPFTAQALLYSPQRDTFLDPRGIYWDLRRKTLVESNETVSGWHYIMEAARLTSRYHYEIDPSDDILQGAGVDPPEGAKKELLVSLLSNRFPDKGLSLLVKSGFVERFWPELFAMTGVEHTKDFHPEGNVWEHTLATFAHRKTRSLTLSMALLLHDVGKSVSSGSKTKPFENHSELGAGMARIFLRKLGFPASFVDEVVFLVRYHMTPAALKGLPLYRVRHLMDSPLFPTLLQLYLADSSATFRGPQGYYEACRIYQTYQKRKKNPYRSLRGL
jgi:poly(A) polymerase